MSAPNPSTPEATRPAPTHTPGPWKAINCAVFSDKKGGTYTVTVAVALSKVGMEEALANARLIAAAPDMLAALQLDATADKLERDDPEQSQMAIARFREAAKEARKAAISKAERGQ